VPSIVLKGYADMDHDREHVYFKPMQVQGNGNCLYHCLGISNTFVDNHIDYAYDTTKLRAYIANAVGKHKWLAKKVFEHFVKTKKGDKNNMVKPNTMEGWKQSILKDGEMGSYAEMVMYTEAFSTNVVMLLQTTERIKVFGTYHTMTDILHYKKGRENNKMWSETVYVWFHCNGNCRKQIKDVCSEANHFVVLEPFVPDGKSNFFI
jgi:hypothetical protein